MKTLLWPVFFIPSMAYASPDGPAEAMAQMAIDKSGLTAVIEAILPPDEEPQNTAEDEAQSDDSDSGANNTGDDD